MARKSEHPRSEHELREAIRALHVEAAGEPFDDEQKERWNELNAELEEQEKRRARIIELARDPRHLEPVNDPDDAPVSRRRARGADVPRHLEESRSRALAAIDAHTDVLTAKAADRLEQVVEEDVTGPEMGLTARYLAAVGDSDYNTAFGKTLRSPLNAHLEWTPKEHEAWNRVRKVVEEQRALGLGSQGGSYPVPFSVDPSVILTSNGAINPARQVARVETIVGNHWTGVASTGTSATFSAELTEVGDNSPTLTQPTADVEKAQAFIPFSIEAGEDWGSLQTEMTRLLADAKDVLEADKFLKGLGHAAHEPAGLIAVSSGGTYAYTTATTATFAIADVYGALRQVPTRWQATSRWLAAPATFDAVYRMVGGGNTTEPPLLPTREGPLLGRPKNDWSSYTSGTVTGSTVASVGDFSNFLILDRVGMNVELIPHTFGTVAGRPLGQRGLYAYWRTTSTALAPMAWRSIVIK